MGTPNQLTHTDSHEVDDRGVRLPIADKAALADSIPTTPRRRLWGRIFRVARAIFVVIMLLMAFRNMTANVDWPYLVIGGAVFASIALLAHLGRYAKPIGPPEKSDRGSISFPAMIVAGGRCGVCGYGLRSLAAAPDGTVQCPECGAAWHTHCLTLLEDEAVRQKARSLANTDARHDTQSLIADDRGVLLIPRFRWPPDGRWAGTPPQARVVARALRARRPLGPWGYRAVLLLAAGGIAYLWIDFARRDAIIGTWLIVPVALLLAFAFANLQPLARVVRSVILSGGLCPQCAQELAPTPVQFDGCVPCQHCGRAWRASDLGPAS